MPSLLGVHHVAIICSDYDCSKHFYHHVLGLEIVAETYRAERDSYKLDLRLADGSQLELFSFPGSPPRPSYPEAIGLRHLAFKVDSVEAYSNYLRGLGVEVEAIRVDPLTQKQYTFFSDPDELPLEIYQL